MIVQFPILLAVAMLAALIGTFPAAGQTSVCRPWCVIYTGGDSRRRHELRLHLLRTVQLDCTGNGILRAERRMPTAKL